MKSVLVTGVAGFLGRHIAREFHGRGWRVVGTDVSAAESAPREVLHDYVTAQLPSELVLERVRAQRPDLCVHCAGTSSVGASVSMPSEDFRGNAVLTFEMLEGLRCHAPKCGFLFLSSAAVYGNPTSLPISEQAVVHPLSPYGFHKRQAELACEEFAVVHGMQTASLRIFSAYGAGLRRQVLWDLASKIAGPHELLLQGTGEESRDFIHARDIARAAAIVAEHARMKGEVYNVAAGCEVKIRNIAEYLLESFHSNKTIVFDGKLPPGIPSRWAADISAIHSLGFDPEINLETGIREYAEWVRPLVMT